MASIIFRRNWGSCGHGDDLVHRRLLRVAVTVAVAVTAAIDTAIAAAIAAAVNTAGERDHHG
jgi:hypothetical protein